MYIESYIFEITDKKTHRLLTQEKLISSVHSDRRGGLLERDNISLSFPIKCLWYVYFALYLITLFVLY